MLKVFSLYSLLVFLVLSSSYSVLKRSQILGLCPQLAQPFLNTFSALKNLENK